MTLSVDSNPRQYTGTGANTALNTVFLFFTATDVVVTQRITATAATTLMVKDTHYTLTGGSSAGATGTVTPIDGATDFTTAMTWTVARAIPLTQGTDYIDNNSFPAESHETGLDRLTMLVQDLRAKVDRSIRYPIDDTTALTSEISNSVDRASKFLSFDASGGAVMSDTPVATGTGKVLLDSSTETAVSVISVSTVNWPLGYDRVELEFIGIRPSAAAAHMVMEPIDNGTAVSTNLRSESIVIQGAAVSATNSAAKWLTDTTQEITAAAVDDALNGHAIFTYFASGLLSGIGQYVYENGSVMRGNTVYYRRHTTLGTRWDGFEVSMDTGNITGQIKLWGLPKA